MDNEGCGNCLQSPQGQLIEYQRIKKLSQEHAKKTGLQVGIYQEGFEFKYSELHLIAGRYPIREVVQVNP